MVGPAAVHAADISELSADDYYGAAYFKQALEHPQVAKQKSRARQIRMVARDLGWKRKKLERAIEKMDSVTGDPLALAKTAVMKGLNSTRVQGRMLDVLINAQEPKHVVMYVRWRGTKLAEAIKDASTIAAVVSKQTPWISTLSLSAIHPKAKDDSKVSVWSGKIGASAMGNINPSRINDYADRLYKRLFEGVKSKPY